MNIEILEDCTRDHAEVIEHYAQISQALADRFNLELQTIVRRIQSNPYHFHLTRSRQFRRANFRKFPYHLLYRVFADQEVIRIIVIRHHHRDPKFGLDRK